MVKHKSHFTTTAKYKHLLNNQSSSSNQVKRWKYRILHLSHFVSVWVQNLGFLRLNHLALVVAGALFSHHSLKRNNLLTVRCPWVSVPPFIPPPWRSSEEKGNTAVDFSNCKTCTLEPHSFSSAQLCIYIQRRNAIIPLLGKVSLGMAEQKLWCWRDVALFICRSFPVCAPEAFLPSHLISVPHWVGTGVCPVCVLPWEAVVAQVKFGFMSPHCVDLSLSPCESLPVGEWVQIPPSPVPTSCISQHRWGILPSSRSFPAGFGAEFSSQLRLEGSGCSSTRSFGMEGGRRGSSKALQWWNTLGYADEILSH